MKQADKLSYLAVLFVGISGFANANSEAVFHMCVPYVEKSAVGEPEAEGGWSVHVRLTEAGAESFEAFTRENVGKTIRIEADARQFARFTIWVPVDSHRLSGQFGSREEARAWQRILTDYLPLEPCGAR